MSIYNIACVQESHQRKSPIFTMGGLDFLYIHCCFVFCILPTSPILGLIMVLKIIWGHGTWCVFRAPHMWDLTELKYGGWILLITCYKNLTRGRFLHSSLLKIHLKLIFIPYHYQGRRIGFSVLKFNSLHSSTHVA